MFRKSLVIGVILKTIMWIRILRGKVKNNQFRLDILSLSFRNILDSRGESKYIPIKDTTKSKIA